MNRNVERVLEIAKRSAALSSFEYARHAHKELIEAGRHR
jgi:hypothetical protein